MPECSPSRAAFFTGRYSLRNGVDAVIGNGHIPQSYMSQFEVTLPKLLSKAGYKSAIVGKWHLGNEQDPAGNCAPATRGFDTFAGTMSPGPPSVDTTAGGIDPTAKQVCGYYQTKAAGACYTAPGDAVRCTPIDAGNADPGTDPARTCLQHGGIFVPNAACGSGPRPTYSDFSRTNAYYVWQRTDIGKVLDPYYVNTNNSCSPSVDRTYLTDAQGSDGVKWWNAQSGPRMLTLSFNTIHTPLQKPPTTLVPDPRDAASTCNNFTPPRALLNMMIESADVEIGRVLSQLGLGRLAANGRTLRSLNLRNTIVVILGDNGSQGAATRAPFNAQRAKGTVYQTGIWVPLIVAGAIVNTPNRSVDSMVNALDLYQLFGEVAGVDVKTTVPPSHVLDSEPMLPYLTNPAQGDIRSINYAELGVGTYSPLPSKRSYPCLIGNVCNDTLVDNQALCENDNAGQWFGPGGSVQRNSCCAVQVWGKQQNPQVSVTIAPVHQHAIRGGTFRGINGAFKLVEFQGLNCSLPITKNSQKAFPWAEYQLGAVNQEFYDLTLNPNRLDNPANELSKNCAPGQDLTTCLPTAIDVKNYLRLEAQLKSIQRSANPQNRCARLGDGNMDLFVNQADIDGWKAFNGHGPSRYDINKDGQTDEKDLAIIQANLGLDCMNICDRADLNRDGKVTAADMTLLNKQYGICKDPLMCGGDLNGSGKVDAADVQLMRNAQRTCQ